MKSEFIARDKDDRLQNFIKNFSFWSKSVLAICVYCDSQSTFRKEQNTMYNGKSIHIRHIFFFK